MSRTRLAVLGSPIGHSLSPALHTAAYGALGLPWTYEAIDVASGSLAEFVVAAADREWRGLSLTMPLKREVLPLLDERHTTVDATGAANTVLMSGGRLTGFNTDVRGIVESFRAAGVPSLDSVVVLGAGATASTAIVASAELGAATVTVAARDVDRARALTRVADLVEVRLVIVSLSEVASLVSAASVDGAGDGTANSRVDGGPDAVISTLPGDAASGLEFDKSTRGTAVLFDVVYDPWPSPLARAWNEAGGAVIPGIEMLVNQALAQVRIFVHGTAESPLPDEGAVEVAMRRAVGLGAAGSVR